MMILLLDDRSKMQMNYRTSVSPSCQSFEPFRFRDEALVNAWPFEQEVHNRHQGLQNE